jgi:diadenosine tetraphosphate (Ap4A) HIT family hydrolase
VHETTPAFTLDERLSASTRSVTDLPLCRLLLRDDARFFWTILVPRRAALVELADLSAAERSMLTEEIVAVGEALRSITPCDKLNVGAIGNIVAQLHVHVLARTVGDAAWPATVWDSGAALPCPPELLAARMSALRTHLGAA